MKTRPWAWVPLLAMAVSPQGCGGNPTASNEATGATEEPIEQGQPVDSAANPVSLQFPLTTVVLFGGGNGTASRCTGVILSRTLILTAAHCLPTTTTFVNFYGTSSPDPINNQVSRVASVAMPPNVTGQDPYPDGVKDANGNWADLAIATLSPAIPAAVAIVPVHLAPANSYADVYMDATWEVGAGRHNGTDNGANELDWIPIRLSSQNDNDGSFTTKTSYCDPGDSGGPAFQLASDGSLTLLGILSGTQNVFAPFDRYTSVSFSSTWSWIQSQIYPPAPTAGSGTTM